MGIQVTAKAVGYYGNRTIAVGETFYIESEEELGNWMERADGATGPETDTGTKGPDDLTKAELSEALEKAGVEHKSTASKPELVELYRQAGLGQQQ